MNALDAPTLGARGTRVSVTRMLEDQYLFLYAFSLTALQDSEVAQEITIATLSEAVARELDKRPFRETRLALLRIALSTGLASGQDATGGEYPAVAGFGIPPGPLSRSIHLDLAVALNRSWLRDALESLTQEERQLMYLAHVAQLGYRDIAFVFDRSEAEVIVAMSRLQLRILDYLACRSSTPSEAPDGN